MICRFNRVLLVAHILVSFTLLSVLIVSCQPVEEFHAHGPMDFHNTAMDAFLEMRKIDPKENLTHDGTFLKKATEHAIKRGSRKPDEAFSLKRIGTSANSGSLDAPKQLSLPSPEGKEKDSILTAAVTSQGAYGTLMLPEDSEAMAIAFSEEIGLGAISKTGALALGSEGQWVEMAESKLKKDASLDYQALLWEMGSGVAEAEQIARGGLNISNEQILLDNMQEWFEKGGGKIHFSSPDISSDGFKLVASEEINEDDAVVTMPMKLIMCKQTARNVVIGGRGKYLGEELQKTFEKNELWGMTIFLLHEYYKEINGAGSKWGPFIRTLRMRFLTTEALRSLDGTIASAMSSKWHKSSDAFMWWSVGSDGPCTPTTGICKVKPKDRGGESRFNIHQIRWAYGVVKQNAARVKQMATGLEFVALIPYYHMMDKNLGVGGGITFDLDGTVSVRAGRDQDEGTAVGIHPGNYSDAEYFLRYFKVPKVPNPNTEIKLSLPGAIPSGSKFHYCSKGTEKQMRSDECKGSYKSESMFWKSKVLTEWRQLMNLPPRLQELRMWATRLHLYGGAEEMALLSQANMAIAGLPIAVDQMPAEEQLMLLGLASTVDEAALITHPGDSEDRPAPQLYTAPDPEEDQEAKRGMENLALLAVQAQSVISSGNTMLNATQAVLNATRDFFAHGVLPMAGLDDLDHFLLKKIGMLAHCGFENDMKIVHGNITKELFCAMRVHLMNESEIHVFCPKAAFVWEENCQNVEFLNFTAVSESNELSVISALRNSINGLLASYPNAIEEDAALIKKAEQRSVEVGSIMLATYRLRYREKDILHSALKHLGSYEEAVRNGTVSFQIEEKRKERDEADLVEEERKTFIEMVRAKAAVVPPLANVEVDMGEKRPKANLTLKEGWNLHDVVVEFCKKNDVQTSYIATLEEALRKRVVSPVPLTLMLGVIIPTTGARKILAIPENSNSAVETSVFCAKNDPSNNAINSQWCKALLKRVDDRLNVTFVRRILLVVPIDAPDTRQLKLVLREGEQHDIRQLVSDFFELYHMPMESVAMMTNEILKRLPTAVVQVPISIGSQRQVIARFALDDNITAVVEAFANFFEVEESMKIAISQRARYGMAPGTFMA